ncbi:MAG: alpha/beta fold hydrolase, partial [Anaerolineales bacterium]
MKVKIYLTLLIILLLTACSNVGTANQAEVVKTVPPRKEPTSKNTQLTYTPSIEASPCPFTLPEGFTEGENVDCGYLIVPEDRSNSDSPEIRLAVAVFHRLNSDSSENPVVYIEGGPGASALEPLQYTISKFNPLLQAHDVIFYDQRGVGFSQPSLDCPEHESYVKDTLTNQLRPEDTLPNLQQALTQCHQRLVDEGIQLEMYNTLQSAADLRDLRLALDIESWNLYGLSYGTRVALETARQHPEGIRSIILDSVVPPEADPIAEAPGNVSHALETFFDACRNNPECDAAFPNLENQFYALIEALDSQPVTIPVENLLTG